MLKLDKSQVTRNLGKKYHLVPYLEKAIANFDDEWQFTYHEKEPDHHWHPSGHCIQPATELYAIANGEVEQEVISGSLRKIFQVGHFWHQWLQYVVLHKLEMCTPDAIERRGLRSWGDAPFHSAAGAGDIAPLEAPNWKGIVDIKTMNSNSFKQARIPERFDAKYEAQINIYMNFFDEEQAIILPVNKDTCEFKELLYTKNDDLCDTIIAKWEFVSACLLAKSAPTIDDDKLFDLKHLLTGPIST